MKAIVPITENSEKGQISPRFGRSPFFAIINLIDNEIIIQKNKFSNETGGVGTKVATWIIKQDIEILVTEQLGPNAKKILEYADIEIYYPGGRNLNEIASAYKQNMLPRYSLESTDGTSSKVDSKKNSFQSQKIGET